MPKARKRKTPVTSTSAGLPAASVHPSPAGTPASTQTQLQQQQQQQPPSAPTPAGRAELEDVKRELEELGGLDAYQRMSLAGQGEDRGGGSERVLIPWMKKLGMGPQKSISTEGQPTGPATKLQMLEVGALKPDNYRTCAHWLEVLPIDLHSQHPSIMEQDFLLLDEKEHQDRWDLVSLSLVINFMPEPKDRGRALRLAHTILRPGGYLFLALPLPCVNNSRYLTMEHLQGIVRLLGFTQLRERWKPGGRMVYWLYQAEQPPAATANVMEPFRKKTVLKTGNRNNFCILL